VRIAEAQPFDLALKVFPIIAQANERNNHPAFQERPEFLILQ